MLPPNQVVVKFLYTSRQDSISLRNAEPNDEDTHFDGFGAVEHYGMFDLVQIEQELLGRKHGAGV